MWRQYSPADLQRQYNTPQWCIRMDKDEVISHFFEYTARGKNLSDLYESEKARATLHKSQLGVAYGNKEHQKLDIFETESTPSDAPILIFFHGGFWQMSSREGSAFVAPALVRSGAVVMVVGYPLAPAATISDIIDQVKEAVAYALKMAESRGSRGVYISGHSAGGHLSAMMLTVDWKAEYNLNPDLFKGVFLISGVFDLLPIAHTTWNDALKLSEEEAWEVSPMKYLETIVAHSRHLDMAMFIVGKNESPEFHRQSREMYQALVDGGVKSRFLMLDADHLQLGEWLSEDNSPMTEEMRKLMKLSKKD